MIHSHWKIIFFVISAQLVLIQMQNNLNLDSDNISSLFEANNENITIIRNAQNRSRKKNTFWAIF